MVITYGEGGWLIHGGGGGTKTLKYFCGGESSKFLPSPGGRGGHQSLYNCNTKKVWTVANGGVGRESLPEGGRGTTSF